MGINQVVFISSYRAIYKEVIIYQKSVYGCSVIETLIRIWFVLKYIRTYNHYVGGHLLNVQMACIILCMT